MQWRREGVIFSARLGDSVNLWRLRIDTKSGRAVADLEPAIDDAGRIGFRVASGAAVSLVLPLDANQGHPRAPVVRET